MINRVIITVLDGFGVGETPDAKEYGDEGSNTLAGIYNNVEKLDIPNLTKLGLFNIEGLGCGEKERLEETIGSYGKCQEQACGKNSPIGHWEMSGYVNKNKFSTYPDGFPKNIIDEFIDKTGVPGVLCNKPGSGTEILKEYGEEHVQTGKVIVYTSGDSVFQIEAHEDIVPVEKLYEMCIIARKILDDNQCNVATVIARPFVGKKADDFKRTYNRKDFESEKFGRTMLDVINDHFGYTCGIGKIGDLFVERGLTDIIHTSGNADGIEKTIEAIKKDNRSNRDLIFTNLVDTDMLYGHRNDIPGYAKALEYFDSKLPEIMNVMRDTDMLVVTADHGNDPSTPSTDHSREYTPLLVFSKSFEGNKNLGIRGSFSDISATILELFNIDETLEGTSFAKDL